MGQSTSSYFPHIKRNPTASPSLLLHLPIDILLLISDKLDETPEAIIALGLTCKAFHTLFIPRAPVLGRRARDFLLLLLEKDPGVGSHSYFCPLCRKLHHFSPECGPLTHEHTTDNPEHKYLRPCYDGSSFCLWCGEYSLGYHHARLVMNRHFYGAPCGLPLRNLNATSVYSSLFPLWKQNWSARIIGDELFLRATHTADSDGMSDRAFRSKIDQGLHYYICNHLNAKYDIDPLKRLRASSYEAGELFAEGRDVVRSCALCLTDYCTTIERKAARNSVLPGIWDRNQSARTRWVITIVAYHRLGNCRSPLGWKWSSITGTLGPGLGSSRGDRGYPAGFARDKWLASQDSQRLEDV